MQSTATLGHVFLLPDEQVFAKAEFTDLFLSLTFAEPPGNNVSLTTVTTILQWGPQDEIRTPRFIRLFCLSFVDW